MNVQNEEEEIVYEYEEEEEVIYEEKDDQISENDYEFESEYILEEESRKESKNLHEADSKALAFGKFLFTPRPHKPRVILNIERRPRRKYTHHIDVNAKSKKFKPNSKSLGKTIEQADKILRKDNLNASIVEKSKIRKSNRDQPKRKYFKKNSQPATETIKQVKTKTQESMKESNHNLTVDMKRETKSKINQESKSRLKNTKKSNFDDSSKLEGIPKRKYRRRKPEEIEAVKASPQIYTLQNIQFQNNLQNVPLQRTSFQSNLTNGVPSNPVQKRGRGRPRKTPTIENNNNIDKPKKSSSMLENVRRELERPPKNKKRGRPPKNPSNEKKTPKSLNQQEKRQKVLEKMRHIRAKKKKKKNIVHDILSNC